jgi:hypothetical protein
MVRVERIPQVGKTEEIEQVTEILTSAVMARQMTDFRYREHPTTDIGSMPATAPGEKE